MTHSSTIETLLEEIFVKPAAEIKHDRFVETLDNASCNGQCRSGECVTVVS